MEWFVANCAKVESLDVYTENAARVSHLNVLQWLKRQPATAHWYLTAAIPHAALAGGLIQSSGFTRTRCATTIRFTSPVRCSMRWKADISTSSST